MESHCDDSQDPQMKEDKKMLDSQVQNVDVCDSKEIEQAMFECPIDLLKSEADDDEKEEQEVFETDVLDDMDLNREEEDVFADSVDNDPVDMNTSEGGREF